MVVILIVKPYIEEEFLFTVPCTSHSHHFMFGKKKKKLRATDFSVSKYTCIYVTRSTIVSTFKGFPSGKGNHLYFFEWCSTTKNPSFTMHIRYII